MLFRTLGVALLVFGSSLAALADIMNGSQPDANAPWETSVTSTHTVLTSDMNRIFREFYAPAEREEIPSLGMDLVRLDRPSRAEMNLAQAPVPEPASLALMGTGLAAFGWLRRRR